ncbi:(Fe-S)-binding protein [Streptomyces sp. NPDC053542]|uniref:(Fe-S)-binding protein n=1 Tax=Streptomyces sp. NPDC053542 TaxID=3365710 RepID=UPI0037D4889C
MTGMDSDAGARPRPARVALFTSCMGDLATGGPARATVEVLEAMGFAVELPRGQTCCGQPALNSGYPAEAGTLLDRWLRIFAPYDAVVTPAGSCAAHLHHHLGRLRAPTPEQRALVQRTYEFSQFVMAYGAGLRLRLRGSVTYHDSCHMARTLGERRAPRELLGRIEGLEVREMAGCDTCCGFGGTFAVKFPEVSVAMADTKLGTAAASGADWLVSADPGCLLHLGGRARKAGPPVRTRHLAELVRDALVPGELPAGPGATAEVPA